MAIGTPTTLGTTFTGGDVPVNLTTTATVPSGALVIVVAGLGSTSATIPTQTITGGSLSWSKDHEVSGVGSGIGWSLAVHSAQAPAGLASSSTLTLDSAAAASEGATFGACYCTGLATSSPVDVFDGQFRAGGSGSVNWDTTATSTTFADTLVIGGAFKDGALTSTPVLGTELQDFQDTSDSWTQTTTYRILSAAASTSLTGTWSGGGTNTDIAIFVAYKADSGAAAAAPGFNPRGMPKAV